MIHEEYFHGVVLKNTQTGKKHKGWGKQINFPRAIKIITSENDQTDLTKNIHFDKGAIQFKITIEVLHLTAAFALL